MVVERVTKRWGCWGRGITAQLPQLHGEKYLSSHFHQKSASYPCTTVDLKLCGRLHRPQGSVFYKVAGKQMLADFNAVISALPLLEG